MVADALSVPQTESMVSPVRVRWKTNFEHILRSLPMSKVWLTTHRRVGLGSVLPSVMSAITQAPGRVRGRSDMLISASPLGAAAAVGAAAEADALPPAGLEQATSRLAQTIATETTRKLDMNFLPFA
jgi:hypothetical protein